MRELMFGAVMAAATCLISTAAAQSYDVISNSGGQAGYLVAQRAAAGSTIETTINVMPGNPLNLVNPANNTPLPSSGSTLITCPGDSRYDSSTRRCSGGNTFGVHVLPHWLAPEQVSQMPPPGVRVSTRVCTSGWYPVYYNGAWQCMLGGSTSRSGIRQ